MGGWTRGDFGEVAGGYLDAIVASSEFSEDHSGTDIANPEFAYRVCEYFLKYTDVFKSPEEWGELYGNMYPIRQIGWFLYKKWFPPTENENEQLVLMVHAVSVSDDANLGKPTIVQDGDYVLLIVREG